MWLKLFTISFLFKFVIVDGWEQLVLAVPVWRKLPENETKRRTSMLWIKNLVKSYNGLYIRLQRWTTNHHLRLQTPILFLNFAHLSSQLGCLYRKYQTKIVPRNTYHYTTCSAFVFNVYPKLIYLISGSVFIK